MSSGAVIVSIDSSFILVLRSSCASSQTVDAALLLLGNLFMVNVLELEVLFDVNLLDRGLLDCCAAMILRTVSLHIRSRQLPHSQLHLLTCPEFPQRDSEFPSRIFFPERRHLVEIHLQIVCHFFRHLVSLARLRT